MALGCGLLLLCLLIYECGALPMVRVHMEDDHHMDYPSITGHDLGTKTHRDIEATGGVEYLRYFGYVLGPENALMEEKVYVEAIKKFQVMANIPQTGKIDDETAKWMNKERCGDPDVEDADINAMMGAVEHLPSVRRRKRYRLYGTSWSKKKKTLTYCVSAYPNETSPILKFYFDRDIDAAMSEWNRIIPKKIVRTTCMKSTEIIIGFRSWGHEDRFKFDGQGGVLAHAFFPSHKINNPHPLTGDIHVDSDENWVTLGNPSGTCFYYVILHEMGHSIGLQHSNIKDSTMWPFYKSCDQTIGLTVDDIKGVQKIYGVPSLPVVASLPILSDEFFKSVELARKYCQKTKRRLCFLEDLKDVIDGDKSFTTNTWAWYDASAPLSFARIKPESPDCATEESIESCHWGKVQVTSRLTPPWKALCCRPPVPKPTSSLEPQPTFDPYDPVAALCGGVFDAIAVVNPSRHPVKPWFDGRQIYYLIFKGSYVYAYSSLQGIKDVPVKISDMFLGFTGERVCSVLPLPLQSDFSFRVIIFTEVEYFLFSDFKIVEVSWKGIIENSLISLVFLPKV